MDDRIRAYTQSRLSEEERTAFEDEMKTDTALRAEVAAISAVQKAFSQGSDDLPENGWARLSKQIDAEGQSAANDNLPFRLSLFQAACIAVTAVLGWEVVGATFLSNEPASYATASAENSGPTVQIVFNSTVVFSDVTDVLSDLQGRIVDGPSALGLYVVSFPDITTRDAAFLALSERVDLTSEVLKN